MWIILGLACIVFFLFLLPKIKTKLQKNLKLKNTLLRVFGAILLTSFVLFLLFAVGKFLLWDVIIGEKAYDDNGIVIRYHRIINIISVKNNSELPIAFCYRTGECEYDSFFDRTVIKDITYSTKRSEAIEIPPGKTTHKWGTFCDAYLFIMTNEEDLNEIVAYNKFSSAYKLGLVDYGLKRTPFLIPCTN